MGLLLAIPRACTLSFYERAPFARRGGLCAAIKYFTVLIWVLEVAHFVHFAAEHQSLLARLTFPKCMGELETNWIGWPAGLVADVSLKKSGGFFLKLNKATPVRVPLPRCYRDLVSVSSSLLTHRQLAVGDVWSLFRPELLFSKERNLHMTGGLLRHTPGDNGGGGGGGGDAFVVLTERRALYLGIVPDFGMRGVFELFCTEKDDVPAGSEARFECSRETIKASAGALRRMYIRDGKGAVYGAHGLSLPSYLSIASGMTIVCLFSVAYVVSVIEQSARHNVAEHCSTVSARRCTA